MKRFVPYSEGEMITIRPFSPEEAPIDDESNCVVLDRVKSISRNLNDLRW